MRRRRRRPRPRPAAARAPGPRPAALGSKRPETSRLETRSPAPRSLQRNTITHSILFVSFYSQARLVKMLLSNYAKRDPPMLGTETHVWIPRSFGVLQFAWFSLEFQHRD